MGYHFKREKQLFIFAGAVFLFFGLVFPENIFSETQEDAPIALSSLKDTILLAFKNNLNIQMQEKEVLVAKADILGARSEFLPNLSANGGYTRNGYIPTLNSTTSGKKDIGIFTGYKNDNILGVNLSQILYNGGANIANYRQAQLGYSVQEETLRASKLDVEFEAKRLYYGLLLSFETLRITQNLFDQAQAHYLDVKSKFDHGTASRFDVLQSKVQVSKIMPELIKAHNAVDLILADLKKLLTLKQKTELKVDDRLTYSLLEIKEDEFLKTAYLNTPEMQLKILGVDISKWAIQMAKAGYRPQINANAEYVYRSNNLSNMFNDRHSNWDVGFTINVPIFDGFSSKAKVDSAKAKYAEANLSRENVADQIAVDIKQACLDLKQSASVIDYSKDNIEEAREALRISEIGYDNGAGTNLDVLDAQVSLAEIENNLSSATYDYLMAKASLDRTMGVSSIQETKNEKK